MGDLSESGWPPEKGGRPSKLGGRPFRKSEISRKKVGDPPRNTLKSSFFSRKTNCPPAEGLEKLIFRQKIQIPASRRPWKIDFPPEKPNTRQPKALKNWFSTRKPKYPPAEGLEKLIFHQKNQIPASRNPHIVKKWCFWVKNRIIFYSWSSLK